MDDHDFLHGEPYNDVGFDRATLYPKLRRAVINEIRAPELLPFQSQLIDFFLNEVRQIEDTMFEVASVEEKEVADLHLLSAKRCKYYLQCYFRARLAKIDKYCFHLLRPEMRSKLSPSEYQYAVGFKDLISKHLKETVLKELPESVQSLEETSSDANMIPEPNLNIHVFCRALEDIGTITIDEESGVTLDLKRNSLALVPYRRIQPYLLSGDIELV